MPVPASRMKLLAESQKQVEPSVMKVVWQAKQLVPVVQLIHKLTQATQAVPSK